MQEGASEARAHHFRCFGQAGRNQMLVDEVEQLRIAVRDLRALNNGVALNFGQDVIRCLGANSARRLACYARNQVRGEAPELVVSVSIVLHGTRH